MMRLFSTVYQTPLCLLPKDSLIYICKIFLNLTLITNTFLDFDFLKNAIFIENPPITFNFNYAFIKLINVQKL